MAEKKPDFFDGKSVLVTGGTGSFGRAFVAAILRESAVARVVVFSRDELKQSEMQRLYRTEDRVRYFIGDVRDASRLARAFHGVDIVVHTAALKQITAAEYNPFEAVRTNIHGAQNVIDAAIDNGVQSVLALSTDKASSPANLYGATKLVSDKLFVSGNAYAANKSTRMSVVRYGNVAGSRGSVIPYFRELKPTGRIPITDERMTRFWITLDEGVRFVRDCVARMRGGEIYVPKLPSMKIIDLAAAVAPAARIDVVGIRPGEKIHEEMVSESAARHTLDMGNHFVIQPEMDWWHGEKLEGNPLADGFSYTSDANTTWLTVEQLRDLLGQV